MDNADLVAKQEAFRYAQMVSTMPKALRLAEIEKIVQQGRDCCECGLPIAENRLRANPYASRCYECQVEVEHRR